MPFLSGMNRNLGQIGQYALIILMMIWGTIALLKVKKTTEVKFSSHKLRVTYKKDRTPANIHSIEGPAIKPILYLNAISLKNLSVEERKQKFVALMLPAILVAKHRMYEKCKRVNHFLKNEQSVSKRDSLWLDSIKKVYKAETAEALIPKLKTHAPSIILAQAALECGWGTSRFFVEANNVFGVWSYNPNEPRVQASMLRGDKAVFVKKYKDLSESVMDYFKTLARVPAYESFRQQRMKSADPDKLLPHLKAYSELREIYIKRLENMIRLNNFDQYDDYYINPKYFEPAKKPQT